MTNLYGKELTFDERKKIERNLSLGFSCAEISRMIGRGKNTVVSEVRRNGGADKYTALKGQKYNENSKKVRSEKLKKAYAENPRVKDGLWHNKILKEIEFMKIQIDILSDSITKLMENLNDQKD